MKRYTKYLQIGNLLAILPHNAVLKVNLNMQPATTIEIRGTETYIERVLVYNKLYLNVKNKQLYQSAYVILLI